MADAVAAAGKVTGSLPLGLTLPLRRSTSAGPAVSPGYQVSSTAWTELIHGMRTAEPVSSTTMVRGLAAATAATRASWLPGRARLVRSWRSASVSWTTTTATVDWRANATAGRVGAPEGES